MKAVLVLLLLCSIMSVVAGGLWINSRPKEGDVCEGTDPNGSYIINKERKCVLASCGDGYYISGTECKKDKTGEDCEPEDGVEGGVYMSNKTGNCELFTCLDGYTFTDNSCEMNEIDDTAPGPAPGPAPTEESIPEPESAEEPAPVPAEEPVPEPESVEEPVLEPESADEPAPESTVETYKVMPVNLYTFK